MTAKEDETKNKKTDNRCNHGKTLYIRFINRDQTNGCNWNGEGRSHDRRDTHVAFEEMRELPNSLRLGYALIIHSRRHLILIAINTTALGDAVKPQCRSATVEKAGMGSFGALDRGVPAQALREAGR